MKYDQIIRTRIIILGIIIFGCSNTDSKEINSSPASQNKFSEYWYQGKAELTRYRLQQARYGEIHEGDAVLIFVTEDFLKDKQVKYEYGDKSKAVSILKLNSTRKFYTGIYPYSMMSSVFTPLSSPGRTLKATASSQEWCGHTYLQLNYRDYQYQGVSHSYFQSEGDQSFVVEGTMLEDEIWTKIRINPADLPTGEIKLIPGLFFLRLRHRELAAEKATTTLSDTQDNTMPGVGLKSYRIEYQNIKRVLEIKFESEFPHRIVAWEEQSMSGFRNPQLLTTRAVKTHSIMTAYWGQNSTADSTFRKQLGL